MNALKSWKVWAGILAILALIGILAPDTTTPPTTQATTATAETPTQDAIPECTGKKDIDADAALFPLENPHPNGDVRITGCVGNIGAATVTVYHNSVTDGPSLSIQGDSDAIRAAARTAAPAMDTTLTAQDIDTALDAILTSEYLVEDNPLGRLSMTYVPAGNDPLRRDTRPRLDLGLTE